jgi:hypothetical protein
MTVAPISPLMRGSGRGPLRVRTGRDAHFPEVLGWTAILVFCAVVAIILLIGRGSILEFAFPALGTAVGAILFATSPRLFLGFAWWLWFLTPEIRRIADFESGWNPVNPLMLTPLLVSGITVVTALKRASALHVKSLFGFIPIFVALAYGTLVGIVTTGTAVALYSLLVWAVPVLMATHLAIRADDYPMHRATLISTFAWGAFVMGAYGLFQYFVAPPWDTFWMIVSDQLTQGMPYPGEIRVFSTMNSSGPFAFVISAGLLLLLIDGGRFRLPMAATACASLMLSLVRAAWLGGALGFVYALSCLAPRRRLQALIFVLCAAFALGVTFLTGSVADTISKRFDTLTNLQDDGSFQLREEFYTEFLSQAVTNVVGAGIGSTSYVTRLGNYGEISGGFYGDSGIMQVPFVLGWFGCFLYVGGVAALLGYGLAGRVPKNDPFLGVAKAIAVMVLAEMIFENTLINVMGCCFFTFLGMCLAARRYHARRALPTPASAHDSAAALEILAATGR